MPAVRPNAHDSDTGPAEGPTVRVRLQSGTAPASCKMELGNDARMNKCGGLFITPNFDGILGDVFWGIRESYVETTTRDDR